MSKPSLLFGAVALLVASPLIPANRAHAQKGKDPLVGTWVLDFGKSDFKRVAAPTKKTVIVTPLDNGLSLKENILNANGGTDSLQFIAKFDGKTYDAPPESPLSQVSFRRIDADTVEETGIERKKPVETVKFQVSNGGKTLTVTTNGTDSPAANTIQVFDRQ